MIYNFVSNCLFFFVANLLSKNIKSLKTKIIYLLNHIKICGAKKMRTSIDIIRCKNINTFRFGPFRFLDYSIFNWSVGDSIVEGVP